MFRLIKTATAAGLLGLVILNPKPFATIVGATVKTFRNAVRIA